MILSGLAVGMGSGAFDWDFSAADSVFDYLAAGRSCNANLYRHH